MSPQSSAFVEQFRGDGQSTGKWIESVDSFFRLVNFPEDKRLPYAYKRLSDDVRKCLYNLICPVEKISGRRWEWDWPRLKVALRGIEKQIMSNKPSGNRSSWLKTFTLGAVVAIGGPAALGWAFAETAICTLGVIAWNRTDTTDVKAKAVASEVGKGNLPPVAHETIRQLGSKTPSKNWSDGWNFNPSLELVIELLKTMDPEKNARS